MRDRYSGGIWARLRFRKPQAEVDEELAFHLEQRVREYEAQGLDPAAARAAAIQRFGDLDGVRAECVRLLDEERRATDRRDWLGGVRQDLSFGVRSALRAPLFTVLAVLTLALGIGGTTAMFSLVNSILLRELPFRQPDRLAWVFSRRTDSDRRPFTIPDFMDFQAQNQSLDGMAAFANWSANLTEEGDPERLQGLRMSAKVFEMLGVQASVGRAFLPEEDTPGMQHVVVLSDGLWRRRFGADPRLVGKTLTLNGASYTVVGVLPREFIFPIKEAELAVPLAPDADPWRNLRTSTNFLRALARLKPGVTLQQAQADLTSVAQRLRQQFPEANGKKQGVTLSPLHDELVGNFRLALWVLLGSVGLVLLMICVNLANLALVRASARHREMAIRTALGATRRRLVRQLVIESLFLALVGGGLGLLFASYGIDLLLAISPTSLPRTAEVGVDFRVLGFSLTVSVLAGVLCGILPAWRVTRVEVNETLKESGRATTGGPRQGRARGLLVVAEIALSLVLLVGAGLLLKSFLRLQAVSPGFDSENVLAVRLSLPRTQFTNRAAVSTFYEKLLQRLEVLPGVEAAGVVSILPLSGLLAAVPFTIEGRAAPPDESLTTDFRVADAGYFRVMRITLVAGREFNERDTAETSPVALISQNLASRYWPGGSPLGARLRVDDNNQGPRLLEIVGVVGDVKHQSLDGEPSPHVYVPIRQFHEDAVVWLTSNQYWLLRTSVEPLSLTASVRHEVQSIAPDVPTSDIRTMEQILSASIAPRRFNLWLLTVFAGVALVLAGMGLYGVISYGVAQRRHEIGIRMALGARGGRVLRLVIGQGMALAGLGVIVGLAAALALTRLIDSLLFSVSATDPSTFIAIALLLLFVALLACWLPARRAMKVDPMSALRSE